jgi:hypothetical protein
MNSVDFPLGGMRCASIFNPTFWTILVAAVPGALPRRFPGQLLADRQGDESMRLMRGGTKVGITSFAGVEIVPILFSPDEARGRAWVKHNIEEVGNFEALLPALYADAQQTAADEVKHV